MLTERRVPVKVRVGDITKVRRTDLIVSAANGIGVPGNNPIAVAVRQAAGDDYAREVREKAMPDGHPHAAGTTYLSSAGNLSTRRIKGIVHAVTMIYPGGHSTYEIVERCVHSSLFAAILFGAKSIAIPNIGTGMGNIDPEVVARSTVRIAQIYAERLKITVVDLDRTFIEAAEIAL
jgi:O-acetyl-ADP-ribose deacetylase (regulator of RNase III)